MIERVTMYCAKCDRCGEILQDGEIVAWADADEAQRMAEESEWREINGRLLCPDCYEVDEETDEYVETFAHIPRTARSVRIISKTP